MSSYWANLIKFGNPNGPGLPEWRPYSPASPTVMGLGDRWGRESVAGSPQKLDFWRRFYATQDAW